MIKKATGTTDESIDLVAGLKGLRSSRSTAMLSPYSEQTIAMFKSGWEIRAMRDFINAELEAKGFESVKRETFKRWVLKLIKVQKLRAHALGELWASAPSLVDAQVISPLGADHATEAVTQGGSQKPGSQFARTYGLEEGCVRRLSKPASPSNTSDTNSIGAVEIKNFSEDEMIARLDDRIAMADEKRGKHGADTSNPVIDIDR
ncbi:MAG TPA: hypothetical protein DCP03_13730 [Polaromonas sp.]|uniref:hypothetical protein n=1 Tax=Polaromonas sp. UBA4122 TaxID=1947074 RepID=UPI000EDF62B0|nr:hypothetical protein [Polaromonas sp. UBA4122]HAL39100.1 hypothetical protein [Polaromonas sp.]